MNRTEKAELAGSLADIFNTTQIGLLVDFRGLNVEQINELRRRLHEESVSMRVLKNRIAKIAIKDTPFAALEEQLIDTRALIFGDEPVPPAKVLSKYMRENAKLSYVAGILITAAGSSLLDGARVISLGNMPSREELLVQMLYVMQAAQTQFVRTLNEIPGKFVRTLAALAESKGAD